MVLEGLDPTEPSDFKNQERQQGKGDPKAYHVAVLLIVAQTPLLLPIEISIYKLSAYVGATTIKYRSMF